MNTRAQPDSHFSTLRVILAYTLIGGALGGVLLNVYDLISTANIRFLSPPILISNLLVGIQFGTAPALLTGLWLTWRRVWRNAPGLLHAVLAGALFSALCGFVHVGYVFGTLQAGLAGAIFMAVVGAVSALILAMLFLPKAEISP